MGIASNKVCDTYFWCVMTHEYYIYFENLKKCNTHREPNSDTIPTYSIVTKHSMLDIMFNCNQTFNQSWSHQGVNI